MFHVKHYYPRYSGQICETFYERSVKLDSYEKNNKYIATTSSIRLINTYKVSIFCSIFTL